MSSSLKFSWGLRAAAGASTCGPGLAGTWGWARAAARTGTKMNFVSRCACQALG